jgi:transmembrane sensor
MFLKNKTDWNLLAKYMAGEASEQESYAVEEWLGKSVENRALYNSIKSDWKLMDTMKTQFNTDKAWNKLHERIAASEGSTVMQDTPLVTVRSPRLFLTPLRVAASIMLVALLGTSIWLITNNTRHISFIAGKEERGKQVVLPDGSSVFLNAGTSLSYSRSFNRKLREVKLDGEAYFEVTPDKTKPFRIYARKACVTVLGTSFNVNARKKNNQVSVYVTTGMVELSETDNRSNRILLKPGNMGMMNNKGITTMAAGNENAIAWKTGILSFRDTKLLEVTSLLNDIYGVNIVLQESGLDTTRINGDYRNDPLDEILQVICKQTHLTVEKSDDMIYLSR